MIDTLLDEDETSRVLIASRVVVRNDFDTAFFCLPLAVWTLLCTRKPNEAAKSISDELLTVLGGDRDAIQVVFHILDTLQRLRDDRSSLKGELTPSSDENDHLCPGEGASSPATRVFHHRTFIIV